MPEFRQSYSNAPANKRNALIRDAGVPTPATSTESEFRRPGVPTPAISTESELHPSVVNAGSVIP
ncbi:MAG: hypothetical protein WBI06_13515 [Paludibacter sp.]